MSKATKFLEQHVGVEFLDLPHVVETAERALSISKRLGLSKQITVETWSTVFDALVEFDLNIANETPILPFSKAEKISAIKLEKCLKEMKIESRKFPKNYYGIIAFKRINDLPFDELITALGPIINGNPAPQNRTDGENKKLAAKFAFRVLTLLEIKATTTRNSTLCRLSAEIYGEPSLDFHHVCRDVLKVDSKRKTGRSWL
jgi:hypothetical protein